MRRSLHADQNVGGVNLFVLALVHFIVGSQQGFVTVHLSRMSRPSAWTEDRRWSTTAGSCRSRFRFSLRQPAFLGEQEHAHHLVDELLASGAVDEYLLAVRIASRIWPSCPAVSLISPT